MCKIDVSGITTALFLSSMMINAASHSSSLPLSVTGTVERSVMATF